MVIGMTKPSPLPPVGPEEPTILQRLKEGYLIWLRIMPHMEKGTRYTIGARIENRFLDILEQTYRAYFSDKHQKLEKITECIVLLDTLKYLLSVAWEGKAISHGQYELMAAKLTEAGKMLGGWKKSTTLQNTPQTAFKGWL